jgi:hypothetical protein
MQRQAVPLLKPSAPLVGTVTGNNITFTVTRQGRNGEQKIEYKGTLEGATMKGTVMMGQNSVEWTAKKATTGSPSASKTAPAARKTVAKLRPPVNRGDVIPASSPDSVMIRSVAMRSTTGQLWAGKSTRSSSVRSASSVLPLQAIERRLPADPCEMARWQPR